MSSTIATTTVFDPQQALKKYEEISLLDPLSIDGLLHLFPLYGKEQNIGALIQLLQEMSDKIREDTQSYSYEEAMAILRDIGIPMGSIKRHGEEPALFVKGLADKMEGLGKVVNSVPRNTIIQYCMCNPKDARERKHTDTVDESRLLESIRMAMPDLEDAILGLNNLYKLSITSPEFSILAKKIEESYSSMISSVVFAYRYISPKVFAQEIRFYYDPIDINGTLYLGPGAVEMPTFVFDHILWSNECQIPFYKEFKLTYVPYCIPYFRDLYHKYDHRPSLLTKVEEEVSSLSEITEVTKNSLKALMNLFNVLISFRTPHKKVAERSYAESAEATRGVGSGGYDTDILTRILDLSVQSRSRCKEIMVNVGIS